MRSTATTISQCECVKKFMSEVQRDSAVVEPDMRAGRNRNPNTDPRDFSVMALASDLRINSHLQVNKTYFRCWPEVGATTRTSGFGISTLLDSTLSISETPAPGTSKLGSFQGLWGHTLSLFTRSASPSVWELFGIRLQPPTMQSGAAFYIERRLIST